MTKEEILKLKGEPPVLLKDGAFGLLIRFPADQSEGLCGIQCSDEEDIRWVHCSKLERVLGSSALREI